MMNKTALVGLWVLLGPQLALAGTLNLTSGLHQPAAAVQNAYRPQVLVQGNKLIYHGNISDASNYKLLQLYQQHAKHITELEITSLGGKAMPSMTLGEFVYQHHLDVSIPRVCLWTCANYVLTAGNHKYLGQHALVMFRGGAEDMSPKKLEKTFDVMLKGWRENKKFAARLAADPGLLQKIRTGFRQKIAAIQQRERHFFKEIGVNRQVVSVGIDELNAPHQQRQYDGWFYSLNDFAKLGVKHMIVNGHQWTPQSWKNYTVIHGGAAQHVAKNTVRIEQIPVSEHTLSAATPTHS